jgi:hypothetical protein
VREEEVPQDEEPGDDSQDEGQTAQLVVASPLAVCADVAVGDGGHAGAAQLGESFPLVAEGLTLGTRLAGE